MHHDLIACVAELEQKQQAIHVREKIYMKVADVNYMAVWVQDLALKKERKNQLKMDLE